MNDERQALFERVRAGQATPEEQARFGGLHGQRAQQVLDAPEEVPFEVRALEPRIPSKARVLNPLPCAECGDMTMEARTRQLQRRVLYIPCFTTLESRM